MPLCRCCYATNRCYWDAGYVVGLEREGTRWVIVEERLLLRPEARCPQAQGALPQVAVSAQAGVIAGAGPTAFALSTASTLQRPGWMPPAAAPLPSPAPPPLPASSVAATEGTRQSAPRPSMFTAESAGVRVTPRATSAP